MGNKMLSLRFSFLLIIALISTIYLKSPLASQESSSNFEKRVSTQSQYELKEECCHIFQKGIYDSYFNQLQIFLKQELQISDLERKLMGSQTSFAKKMTQFISCCNTQPQTPEEMREYHENMLMRLRKLIKYKKSLQDEIDPVSGESIRFIDNLCLWMYTKPHLMPSFTKFLQSVVPVNLKREALMNPICHVIDRLHADIKKMPEHSGYFSPPERTDDHHAGYVPSHLFEAFSTPFIATPRVAMRDLDKGIVPEFKNYLSVLQEQQKRHLYINLMWRTELERPYCLAIEDLSKKKEYKKAFYVCTLDKNSDFYLQRGVYADRANAEDFKKAFIFEMFLRDDVDCAYKWPNQFDLDSWQQKCEMVLQDVHANYFDGRSQLSLKERLDFIELTYVLIVKALCKEIQPDNANISCKSTIDRGPSLLCAVYAYSCLESKKRFSNDEKRQILTILFAPPLFSHNRPSHDPRIERANSLIGFLLDSK